MKDSAGSYESLKGYLDAVKDSKDFDVLNGPDSLIHQAMSRMLSLYFRHG